jgi:P-type Cu+ transporter
MIAGILAVYFTDRMSLTVTRETRLQCFHCGETCPNDKIHDEEKYFCCEGCRMVFHILDQSGLCDYYNLNENPGISQRIRPRKNKFAFLEDEKIQAKLVSFRDDKQVHISFYLPQMHCSSCLYLLENLHRLHAGVITCKVNFTRKEADIIYDPSLTSLRKIAETLTGIGYEPYISLHDLDKSSLKGRRDRPAMHKRMIFQLGVAGFCFGNIMLMSFPEYLGINAAETGLRSIFRWFNFGLALPVLLYSSLPFYESSWKSLRNRFLNIDTPIALAIILTFIRSAIDVIGGTGGGYFDSMSGIVFFMLAGRVLQDKTYRQLSFERDYTSYFPVAVSVIKDEKETTVSLPEIKPGQTLLIHHEELIPADGILTKGKAYIDYSFVTGESAPVFKEVGELVYAGGKQTGGIIEILVVKEVAQSYLTKLWNREGSVEIKNDISFVHLLSRYFSIIVLAVALVAGIYWQVNEPERVWTAVTSVFIIACPCALLLSNSFTNGNILRILGKNQFYLRNPETIENIASADHIVFDKTGTLTSTKEQDIKYHGEEIKEKDKQYILSLALASTHPLSKALAKYLERSGTKVLSIDNFSETRGQGIGGSVDGRIIKLGSAEFTGHPENSDTGTHVYLNIDGRKPGYFSFANHYRPSMPALIRELNKDHRLSVLSGDNDAEKGNLGKWMGKNAVLLFNRQPEDKLAYIKYLQSGGETVMMIGDGLNDAGALKQSDAGIALAEDANNFTPASDAILKAGMLSKLPRFIRLCKANRQIVIASFVLSIVYNIIGLFFAVQGHLSPLTAAILMPSSTLSIILITFGSSALFAKKLRL